MKVLNKEVEECCLCPCLNHLDLDGSPYCNMLQKDIKDSNTIDKDCPFNKPITKEVIEGFGFKGQEANSVYYKMEGYRLVYWPNKPYRITSVFKTYTDGDEVKIFDGTITSKPHLEFILQSLNII